MPLPPDRGNDPSRKPSMPLNMVRGGTVCDPKDQGHGGHLVKGSGKAAICMPTPGADSRPRWGAAGEVRGKSRHSQQFKQHRE